MFFLLFQEFIQGISQFSVKGDKEAKLKCKRFNDLKSNGFGLTSFKI